MRKLLSEFPVLYLQIHPTKNNSIDPVVLTSGSNQEIWWLGECKHEWYGRISSRVGKNQGCPYCSGKRVLAGFNDLATTHPHIAKQWHPTKNDNLFPNRVSVGSKMKVWWLGECGHEWDCAIYDRLKTNCPYCSGKRVLAGFNDLATTHPHIAKQWHVIKNGNLFPDRVTAGSQKKAWWCCEKNHEWEAVIGSRTKSSKPRGCPVCSGKKVFTGLNDLATCYPNIAADWHPIKNYELFPDKVLFGTTRKVWWLGECGHEWEAQVNNRVHLNSGCPYCAGKKVLAGFNDLATCYPEISLQWHPSKNIMKSHLGLI